MKAAATLAALIACAAPATARTASDLSAFVEANVLGIFYHEMGHAAIHTEGLPIFGQEEDAADVFSIFMIDALFDEDTAQSLAADAVLGFEGEARLREDAGEEVAWWDVHGPDEQRVYNTACLFYGANPDARRDFAAIVALPEERALGCPEEYDQAAESWGAVLDGMEDVAGRPPLTFRGDGSPASAVLAEEVRQLNAELRLAAPVTVAVERCGEANAFYDPERHRITFCSEFTDHLRDIEALIFR